MFKLAGILLCASLVCGCHSGSAAGAKTNYYYEDADASKSAPDGRGFEDPSKVASSLVTKAQVQGLEAQQAKLAAQYKEKPNDADLKAQFVKETDDLASKEMDCGELLPAEKYPAALKYFRQVLKVDPTNPFASEGAETITAIYKQMGRPIPQ